MICKGHQNTGHFNFRKKICEHRRTFQFTKENVSINFRFPQENLWPSKDFPIYKRKCEYKFEHHIHTPIKKKLLTKFYIFYTSCTIGNLYTIFLQNWVETNRFCFVALIAMWYLFRWWRRWDPWSLGRQWAPKTWVFSSFH